MDTGAHKFIALNYMIELYCLALYVDSLDSGSTFHQGALTDVMFELSLSLSLSLAS